MQKSMLVEIVRSLNKKEIRELNKWLQSPAHNQRQDVIDLFHYLCKNLTNSDEYRTKERAWNAVFPGKPFDDAVMRQVMFFLLKSLEAYLVFTDVHEDEVQTQIALARIYRHRKLEKSYRQAHRLGMELLHGQPLRNPYYLMHRYFLEREEYEHRINITQNDLVNLQELSDALERWFIVEKLLVSNGMIAHHMVYQKANYDPGLIHQVLEYLEQHQNLLEEPGIAVYYYAHRTMTNLEEQRFFDGFEKMVLDGQEAFLTKEEMLYLYRIALNYCTAKVNQGNTDYARRALAFYRQGMEKGILLVNNIITRYNFGNAVAFALRVRDFEWAEQFIERFQHYLDERERNSIVNFNWSRLFFEKGDYNKAQRLLLEFEYDDMLFNIIAKTMLLKIYYEQDEYDAFESLLDSLRIYLQRKEALDPIRKQGYKNMVSLMKKMLNLGPHAKMQRERLVGLVKETQPLMERDWLLRQLK